ncbi:GNAT family N-acetyltransferase [Bifidobacterium leontopitheci]|uniref:Acetyltransferase n=1 Tax=Bifidobacterium leontopitheci TaxID=2650774 RepID=A0A6I1GV20_9BIFI|nr:GNAT family N-acetyltransferase [Bifidobacterium leontopitheci]KAB7790301.1 acetyltransferase [Bifidobacterium leontopitheci]
MTKTIDTERLLLRPWKVGDEADAASLFRYASDPQIGPMCGWPPHTSVEGSANIIRDVFAAENNWAITVNGTGNGNEPIGCIELRPVKRIAGSVEPDCERYRSGNVLEVGYWIGRPFWGFGYMSEALDAVIGHAFTALHANAVWGAYYQENVRSGRVMERCGMWMAGESWHVLNLIGEYHDEFLRIITAEEWWADHDAAK